MEKLKNNPFKKDSKAWLFCEISNVNYDNGYSDTVGLEKLTKYGLKTINGGDWCRSDGTLGKYFNIDRIKGKGRIVAVRLMGYKKNNFDTRISKEILDFYKKAQFPCKVLNVKSKYVELDHKDGRKDDFNFSTEQRKEDFQPLHKAANDAKRQHCKDCKKTGLRFDAKKLGYKVSQWIGIAEYKGSCVGCFWYDPAEFNAQVSSKFLEKDIKFSEEHLDKSGTNLPNKEKKEWIHNADDLTLALEKGEKSQKECADEALDLLNK